MNPFTLRQQTILPIDLAHAWELVSQTSNINHAIGLPPIRFTERIIDNKVQVIGSNQVLGITSHWIEHPFEWVNEQEFCVEREFLDVPGLDRLVGGTRIERDTAISTLVETYVTVYPKNPLGYPAGRLIAQRMVYSQARFYADLARKLGTQQTDYFPLASKVNYHREALRMGLQRLNQHQLEPAIIQKLTHRLQTGRDEDVVTMQPFVLADQWQTDRIETLRVFLYATAAGMLDLHWDVLCPNCRVSKASANSLRDLAGSAHCEVCNIRYDANFDEYVELRFSINPDIRYASNTMYCALGSPALNQHIIAQHRLKPNQSQAFHVNLEHGNYRLRVLGSEQRCIVQASGESHITAIHVDITSAGLHEQILHVKAGSVEIACNNQAISEQLLILERDAWGSRQVSAALVTSMQEFRSLFSSEVLAPGLGLAVKNLAILFSDIKDSTPMYEQFGDSTAYAVVRDHFTTLFNTINQHDGAIVKTIGDAVMAVFSRTSDAVQAALNIQRQIAEFNQQRPDRPPIVIKLGLHSGACIAVNANDVLDYFGTTVNVAARAQGLSLGNDIVITAEVMQAPYVAALVAAQQIPTTQFEHNLKGLSNRYTLYRLECPFPPH